MGRRQSNYSLKGGEKPMTTIDHENLLENQRKELAELFISFFEDHMDFSTFRNRYDAYLTTSFEYARQLGWV